jgi:hypothetical protein
MPHSPMPVCRRVVRREFGALMVMLHGRDRGGHRRRCRHGGGGGGDGGNGGGGE